MWEQRNLPKERGQRSAWQTTGALRKPSGSLRRRSSGRGGWPGGDHTLRARRTGMRPGPENLGAAKARRSLGHNVDEVMRGAAIE